MKFSVYAILLVVAFASNFSIEVYAQTIAPGTYNLPEDGNILPDGTFSDRNEIGQDTTVNVFSGGRIGNSTDVGFGGGVVNLRGGTLGQNFSVLADGHLEMASGSVEGTVIVEDGGTAEISSGFIGTLGGGGLSVRTGGAVSLSGGNIGGLTVQSDGSAVVSGGVFERLNVFNGGLVTLRGNDFLLNGVSVSQTVISPGAADVLSGTLEDGSPFVVTRLDRDLNLQDIQLATVPIPSVNTNPILVDNRVDAPTGLRVGQSLSLVNGGELQRNFTTVDAALEISGGDIGTNLELLRTEANFSGGNFGFELDAFDGTVLSVSDGNFGELSAHSGSEVSISGGSFRGAVEAFEGSVINVSGGQFNGGDESLFAFSGGEINLIGSDFILDGVDLDALSSDVPFVITDRDVLLSGIYSDGTAFEYFLSTRAGDDVGFAFAEDSRLTVSLSSVPEPSSTVLLFGAALFTISFRRR